MVKEDKKKYVAGYLFDSESGDYSTAAKKFPEIEGISIGVSHDGKSTAKFKNFDLSGFGELFGEKSLSEQLLESLPKPDIICASPPCESWSFMTSVSNDVGSQGNKHGRIKPHKFTDKITFSLQELGLDSGFVKTDGNRLQKYCRINGELCWVNTWEIIKDISPKCWLIEQPDNYAWLYLQEQMMNVPECYIKRLYYSAYDLTFSCKRECFASNIDLDLKKEMVRGTGSSVKSSEDKRGKISQSYMSKSSIPISLLEDVYSQFLDHLKKIEEKDES